MGFRIGDGEGSSIGFQIAVETLEIALGVELFEDGTESSRSWCRDIQSGNGLVLLGLDAGSPAGLMAARYTSLWSVPTAVTSLSL